jgi:hypothetical protein
MTDQPENDLKTESPIQELAPETARKRKDGKASVRQSSGGLIRSSRAVVLMILAFGLGVLLDHFFLHPGATTVACETAVMLAAGSTLGDFTLYDADDNTFAFSTLCAGRAALIVCEDKDAGSQNGDFKKRFGVLQDTLGDQVVLLPVADVSNFNYWPAKRFVKRALRAAGNKDGITVYADWSGEGRTALRPRPKLSNLVLVDKGHKVLWASSGQLTKPQEDELVELVKSVAR